MEQVLDLSTKKIAQETSQDFEQQHHQQRPTISFCKEEEEEKEEEPNCQESRENECETPKQRMVKSRVYSTGSEDSTTFDRSNRPASHDDESRIPPTSSAPYYPAYPSFYPPNYLKFQQQIMSQWLMASQLAHHVPPAYFSQNFLQNAVHPLTAEQKSSQPYSPSALSASQAGGAAHNYFPAPLLPAGLPPAKNTFDHPKSLASKPDVEKLPTKNRKRCTTDGSAREPKSKKSKCKEKQVVTSQSANGLAPFTAIMNHNLLLPNLPSALSDSKLSTTETRKTLAASEVADITSVAAKKSFRSQSFEHSNDSLSSGSEKSSLDNFKILAGFGESTPKENDSRSSQQSPTSSSSNNYNDALHASADCSDNETDLTEYREKRRKNNAAAKRSRDQRRIQEEAIAVRVRQLCDENVQLKAELTALKSRSAELEKFLELKKQISARTSR